MDAHRRASRLAPPSIVSHTQTHAYRVGEAVAIDCIMNTMIANVQGHVTDAEARRVLDLYAKLGLPCSIRAWPRGTDVARRLNFLTAGR